jgi:hypothetical protein
MTNHDELPTTLEDLALAIDFAARMVREERPRFSEQCEQNLRRLSTIPPAAVESVLVETARASASFRVVETPEAEAA